jgi:hypothetical protein
MQELAKEEAKKLKKFATKQEINKLNITTFDPKHFKSCIYGQMTGDCYSERADELIQNCATKVYVPNPSFSNMESLRLNGKPWDVSCTNRAYTYHSPIEMVILPAHGGSNNALAIIDYLKGKTNRLIFPKQ